MLKPSHNRYNTRSHIVLDIALRKTNTGQQALSFLEPETWTKISHSTKNVKAALSLAPAQVNKLVWI